MFIINTVGSVISRLDTNQFKNLSKLSSAVTFPSLGTSVKYDLSFGKISISTP